MACEFTIVTAVTPDYLKVFKWSFSSWLAKPQFCGRPIIVFHHGFNQGSEPRELAFIKDHYQDWTFVDWNMKKKMTQREIMLSCFILGAAEYVKTPYFVKIDADCYFHDKQDVWDDNDFKHDIASHSWRYTKPGWWLKALDNYYYERKEIVDTSQTGSIGHKRIQSICCLHRTEFVQSLAKRFGGRLPVPSHDTVVWYYADKDDGRSWSSKNLKKRGVGHQKRWRKVREQVCSSPSAWNPIMSKSILNNIQIDITNRCNLCCDDCDRNCGFLFPTADMDVSQVWEFVRSSIKLNHKWHRIDVIGGEPTLHSNLNVIFDMLHTYIAHSQKTKVRFSTNGYGDVVNDVLQSIPPWIKVRNSSKESRQQGHDLYHCAPIDFGVDNARACSIPWRCGISLTRFGYFPCGAGAAVARAFGLNIGIMDLNNVTAEALRNQMRHICKYCGHSVSLTGKDTKVPVSKSWQCVKEQDYETQLAVY